MNKSIKVMIIEDDTKLLTINEEYLNSFDDIDVVASEATKENGLKKALELQPDVLILDIHPTYDDDQCGIDIAFEISIKAPQIKIIIIDCILDEDTIRSTIGLGVASNYLVDSDTKQLPEAIRNAYKGMDILDNAVIQFIVKDYQEALKTTMSNLTKQQLKILQLFYIGKSVEEVASILNLELQSVRNYQQNIAKRCFGWKWHFRKLSTVELAYRAKIMGLF